MAVPPAFRRPVPLYLRVVLASLLGGASGIAFGSAPFALGFGNADLGQLGMLVVRMLKALAGPIVFLAVLDAVVRTHIPARKGLVLVCLSLANAAVALAIGLGIANGLHFGEHQFESARKGAEAVHAELLPRAHAASETGSLVPDNLIDPFRNNDVISIALLALLLGVALRSMKRDGSDEAAQATLERGISAALGAVTKMLGWLVELVPVAVFGVVAKVVGASDFSVFRSLGAFVATIVLGLIVHSTVYYSALLTILGRTSPARFFRGSADAVATALSTSSSLATLPVTLKSLERMNVSASSARLAACVGTNLNHDGIILYEAAATIFVAQAFGVHLSFAEQLRVGLAAALAGFGVAGVPEAGLISLPIVLGSAGLPPAIVSVVIPLLLPVDWVLGRCRAATNVISDMTVATLLDGLTGSQRTRGSDADN